MLKRQYVISAAVLLALPLAGCGALKGNGGPKTPTVGQRVSILSNDNSIKVDPTTESVAVVLPEPVVNPNWSQSGGNASKSMGHPALGAAREKVWEARVVGSTNKQRLASSPVIADNRLFVGKIVGRCTLRRYHHLALNIAVVLREDRRRYGQHRGTE